MTDEIIPLNSADEALDRLASDLQTFGPSGGAPDWLLTGVWLGCGRSAYLATPSIEVLEDGFLARPLVVDHPDGVRAGIEEALPDIQGRLLARGSHVVLPEQLSPPEPPPALHRWPNGPYLLSVLLRVAECGTMRHRIGCALLFESEAGRRLLVGTDRTTLAMMLSEDDPLIDHYCSECEQVSLAEYRALVAA